MPDGRRFRVPGGTYFFTINLLERCSDLLVGHIDALREAVLELCSILVYERGLMKLGRRRTVADNCGCRYPNQ